MEYQEKIVLELAEWIEENVHIPLKIEHVAQRSGYSKWHFQRLFHSVMHISIGNYIRNKKLESAAKDLLQGKEAVIDISVKYGFDSQQSFTRSFIRKYKLPPGKFRKKNLASLMTPT